MPRKSKQGPLHVKFRLIVTHRMPKSVAIRKLKEALRTGFIPDGIKIAYIDWEKGNSTGELGEGEIDEGTLEQMRGFYYAMQAGKTRVGVVEE